MRSPGRVEYAIAGASIREACKRAREFGTTEAERDVLAAVVELVSSYSRLEDRLSLARIAECAQRHPKTVAKALKRLSAVRVVVYEPGVGSGNVSLVGLPAAPRRGAPTGSLRARKRGAELGAKKGAQLRSKKGASGRSPPEKTSEKTAEKSATDHLPEELTALLDRLGAPLHRSQLERVGDIWSENAELVSRSLAEALRGENPPALFYAKLTAASRNGSSSVRSPEEQLKRWLTGPGLAVLDEDAVEILRSNFGLDGDELEAAIERRREAAKGRS